MKKKVKVLVEINTYRKKYCSNYCSFIIFPETRCWLDAHCSLFEENLSYNPKNGRYLRCSKCIEITDKGVEKCQK